MKPKQTQLNESQEQLKLPTIVTMKSHNGDVYTGEVQDDLPHGNGKIIYHDGDVYEGQFFNGKPNGMGTMKYLDDDVYIGMFQNGQPNG